MPKITFLPSQAAIDVPPGTELLAAARQAGVEIDSACGGKGTCGKCIVRLVAGEVAGEGPNVLPSADAADRYVQACRARAVQTPVIVEVPPPLGLKGGQFAEDEGAFLARRRLLPEGCRLDPLAVKQAISVPPPRPADGLSDLDRLVRAVQKEHGRLEVTCGLGVMRVLADALRAKDALVTVTYVHDGQELRVTRIEFGDQTSRHYGAAVDVGTTTVAVQLLDLAAGRIAATRSDYNGQVTCGLDVISRINYARRPGGLQELRTRVLETINNLLAHAAASQQVDSRQIAIATISGNTTMIHLLLGMNPDYIRLAPYTPTAMDIPYLSAGEVGIEIHPEAWVCFSPGVGSYVGGDITAGLLSTDLLRDSKDISLFIDIGTNGELVLGNSDFLLGCACSAGPAFEGGGIDGGMRAAAGAIERVEVDEHTGQGRYSTIGDARPQGICGSGMIDLLANLFLTGWIDPAGKFERNRPSPCISIDGKHARYVLAPGNQTATGRPITVSETDIDNIIRAKAAIFSASALMLEQIGIGSKDLAHIYIAGGFGRFLDLDKAIVLGLLPDVPREKFRFIGNASLAGSAMVAASKDCRRRQRELADRMTYLDLSTTPSYMNQYTGALFLPHTDPGRFPSVAEALAKARR